MHGLHNVGVTSVIQDFDSRLNARYRYLKKTKLKWDNTYYMSTDREYLAEGTQSFFEDNDEQIPPNGIHNFVNTRAELFSYDRQLYDFITEIFPCKNKLLIRCDAIKGKTGRSLQAIYFVKITSVMQNIKVTLNLPWKNKPI